MRCQHRNIKLGMWIFTLASASASQFIAMTSRALSVQRVRVHDYMELLVDARKGLWEGKTEMLRRRENREVRRVSKKESIVRIHAHLLCVPSVKR